MTQLNLTTMKSVLICTNMTAAVSAQSENPNGLFYPVEEDNKLKMAQIVAVDVCDQRSDPIMIPCATASPPGGSLWS